MALLGRRLAVSIPDTVLEDKDSLREKTTKLGTIARACAIYGVDVVEVFRDPGGQGEADVIMKVLTYLETPQYLRRRLYPLDEALRYAGMLPPLRIPSHKQKIPISELKLGDVREGVTNEDGTVDVGLDEAVTLGLRGRPGRRVTVRVTSLAPLSAVTVPREDVPGYWGYLVETKSVGELLSDPRFTMTIATSRMGEPLSESLGRLERSIRAAVGVKLVFGSPSRGLFQIVGRDLEKRVSIVVNLFPEQKVETVRTEEAIFAGLGLVSVLSAGKA
ncbi:MAG TPA: putative RNA uridine N3 methyltransferase [Nitrososphaerales archaeon]|nr:putative RNA uridine N3 methyltransferase [Nitrososphaerales archaeon]